ncbi:MAG: hypothetical protein KA175_17535 [Flavobacteriales bacterium]|nr:hypothetical protein [Flavobacteriales bacterium]MBP6699427.1 hypothetical protein [Flavobacteriales bacterium]
MRQILLGAAFALLTTLPALYAQDGPMLSGQRLLELFGKVDQVIMIVPGFEYTYNGEWLRGMKLEDPNTISFTRGKVVHYYDLRHITMVQDEGGYIRVRAQ